MTGSVKSKTCEFTTSDSVPAGEYTVYTLYTANRWSKEGNHYKASFPDDWGAGGNFIMFDDASSTHLRDRMFMKTDAGEVSISGAGNEVIDFSFYHLTSVVRFHLTSDYDAESMELGSSLELKETSGRPFFNTYDYLERMDVMDLTMPEDTRVSEITLYPTATIPFKKNGDTWELDCWMPVFPTVGSTAGISLTIDTHILVDGSANFQQDFGTGSGLTFNDELSFMPDGFEVGKGYYFNLKADIW